MSSNKHADGWTSDEILMPNDKFILNYIKSFNDIYETIGINFFL